MLPSAQQIESLADSWGVNRLSVYAYAALMQQVPVNPGQVGAFVASLQGVAQGFGFPTDIVLGYIQNKGFIPGSAAQLLSYAQDQAWYDHATPPQQISAPVAGLGYIGSATNFGPFGNPPPATGGTPPGQGRFFGLQLPSFAQNPKELLIVGAVIGGGYLLLKRRR